MSGIVLDLILAALLLFFLWRGYSKGFVLTLCGLLAVVVAFVGASFLAGVLSPKGQSLVEKYDMLQYYWRKEFAYADAVPAA